MNKLLPSLILCLAATGVSLSAHAGGDAAKGATLAASCGGCHGANGEGMGPNPKLAGLAEADFIKAMKEYKDGTRDNALMKGLAAPLSDQDLADLAAYYATK